MADMTSTIKAKSDQLNAGDILAGPVTVRVTGVDVRGGDQPVSIHTEGDLQPYKPCLSMRRVLAKLWGGETDLWIGKHMVLFNDPTVIWAGKPEGGIRISQMEGLNKKEEVTVRASKRAVTKYLIDPLVIQQAQPETPPPTFETIKELMNNCNDANGMAAYGDLIKEHAKTFTADQMSFLRQHYKDCLEIINQ